MRCFRICIHASNHSKNVYECTNLLEFLQVAGALGSLVGNPADLALLRMQADGILPLVQRRHYKYAHTLR